MSKPIQIKPDTRFGRLVVLESFIAPVGKRTATKCHCQCDCGNTTSVWYKHLRRKHSQSCGCLRAEVARKAGLKHGMSDTTEYWALFHAVRRCINPQDHAWKNYGGRGITVCKRWHDGRKIFYKRFLKDMGPKPSPELTLERWDNNLGYNPSNCYWATRREQLLNRRNLPLKVA